MVIGPVRNEYWFCQDCLGYGHWSCQECILDMIIGPVRNVYWKWSLVLSGMDIGYDHWSCQEWISDMCIGPVRNWYWIGSLVLSGINIGFVHWSCQEWILDRVIGPVRNEYRICSLVLSGMDIGYDKCLKLNPRMWFLLSNYVVFAIWLCYLSRSDTPPLLGIVFKRVRDEIMIKLIFDSLLHGSVYCMYVFSDNVWL